MVVSGFDNAIVRDMEPSTVVWRRHWPSAVCPVTGLHAYEPITIGLQCVFCWQFVVWEECGEMQRWGTYYTLKLTDVSAQN